MSVLILACTAAGGLGGAGLAYAAGFYTQLMSLGLNSNKGPGLLKSGLIGTFAGAVIGAGITHITAPPTVAESCVDRMEAGEAVMLTKDAAGAMVCLPRPQLTLP